jgi:multidrug resistance efflux pump
MPPGDTSRMTGYQHHNRGSALGDTFLLVRVVAASTLVGFLAFCVANTALVWRKRNARKGGSEPGRTGGRRLSWGCLIAGAVLIPAAAIHREMTRGEGTLTGEGLYTLRAHDDLQVEWLRDGGVTGEGELLARFGSGSRSAHAYELQARLARAEAERGVLDLLPLSPDPELTRRHQAVTLERTQAQQELGQAVIAAEVAGRDLTAQLFSRKESLARLELTLTARRKELDRVTLKRTHARQQLSRYQSLAASGSVSASEHQDAVKASQDADIELSSLTQEVKDLLAEKDEIRAHLDKLEAGRADPSAPVRKQVVTLTARVARLEADEADLKAKVELDLARSTKLRDAEKVQAAAKVREHQAVVDSLNREREVFAPFPGTLAYRAGSPNATRPGSPNATRPGGPLAVLAPADGFLLTARMAEADADAIRNGAGVTVELSDDSPERRLPARLHKTTALAHEPGVVAVHLVCQPPPETVRRLAEGEKLTVAFTWHPPVQAMWPFRTGLVLFAGGLFGLMLTTGWQAVKRSRR